MLNLPKFNKKKCLIPNPRLLWTMIYPHKGVSDMCISGSHCILDMSVIIYCLMHEYV